MKRIWSMLVVSVLALSLALVVPVAATAGPSLMAFNGEAAAGYALSHARDIPPFDSACTRFVSEALWAGNLEKTTRWTDRGTYGRLQKRTGTPATNEANLLIAYLESAYPGTQQADISSSLRTNAVPAAKPGDFIAYDWDSDGKIDHLAFVVGIASGAYPEVSEMGIEGVKPASYSKRGWTWSELHHDWLQVRYPRMRAYLVKIGTVVGRY